MSAPFDALVAASRAVNAARAVMFDEANRAEIGSQVSREEN